MKRGTVIFLAVAISATALLSCNKDDDDDNNNTVSRTDSVFVLMASMSNYAEITAGQIASSKAQDSGIAAFGSMMVQEHTTASQQLKSMAGNLNLQTADSLDAQHVALRDSLMSLSGSRFDSVYIQSQVRDHQTAIALFQAEANAGQHSDLRNFANDMLPHLQMHLQHADSLASAH